MTTQASEHQHQVSFIRWCEAQFHRIPELCNVHAIPNGGHRHKAVAGKLKAEGVVAGEPDVEIGVARGGFVGLAIEFKAGTGAPTKSQIERITMRQKAGWCVVVCWDWEAAARTTLGYFGMLELRL